MSLMDSNQQTTQHFVKIGLDGDGWGILLS